MASLARLCGVFFRIANFTFGGGAATTAALQRDLVQKRGWLSEVDFGLCYALSRVTPGTNLFAFCTAAAWRMRGWVAALLALVVASLPACAVTWGVTAGFDKLSANRWAAVGIAGALAASAGILVASFWLLVRPALTRGNMVRSVVIVAVSIVLSLRFDVGPISVLALAAVAGWFWKEAEA
ncbi:MAG TPA: chromate transporter [Bryobacteraceae bacterium]|nr:chromate transporter [Bryobacteraceae bacterium]